MVQPVMIPTNNLCHFDVIYSCGDPQAETTVRLLCSPVLLHVKPLCSYVYCDRHRSLQPPLNITFGTLSVSSSNFCHFAILEACGHLILLSSDVLFAGTVFITWRLCGVLPGLAPPLSHQVLDLCIVMFAVALCFSCSTDGSQGPSHSCRFFRPNTLNC